MKKYNRIGLGQMIKDKANYSCLIALHNKEIIGFTLGQHAAGVFWGDWIGVRKDFRRSRVALSLVKKCEGRLKNL